MASTRSESVQFFFPHVEHASYIVDGADGCKRVEISL